MESNGKIENKTAVEDSVTKDDIIPERGIVSSGVPDVVKEISLAEVAKVEEKIVKQLEFYFSDSNLPYDKFMQNEIKNDNGWVKISVLLTFKRLAAISKDPTIIASAIKNATNCILEVDETNEKIRRKSDNAVPVANQEFLNEMIERSIYCKGFPKTATMDELLDFAATFGDKIITKVTLRRLKTKEFKGSLYFTFNCKEEAEKFLKLDTVKYKDIELERKWEKDFLVEKKQEFEMKLAKKDEKMKAETEKFFKKGYLLKVDNFTEGITIDSIKTVCAELEWPVAFVKLVDDQKLAWIRLKPVKFAKDLLEELADKKNDLNLTFTLPTEEVEQTVLNEMTKEMKDVLIMKDRIKRERNKNKGGKRYNNKRKSEDVNNGNKKVKTVNNE